MNRKSALFAVVLLLSAPRIASAGWVAKQTTKGEGAGAGQSATLSFDNDLLRIDSEPNPSVIIDIGAGKFTFLNHQKKKHASITFAEVIKMRDQQIAMIKEQLPKMPPEVKKQFEEQLKAMQGGESALKLKATGKKDKVNGYECEIFTFVTTEGEGEACIASKCPGVDVEGFKKAIIKLSDRLAALGGGPGSFTASLQLGKYGIPVRTKQPFKADAKQRVEAVSEMSEIKTTKIDPTRFKVPGDYKEDDLKRVMGLEQAEPAEPSPKP
jgi:hypothetical protein